MVTFKTKIFHPNVHFKVIDDFKVESHVKYDMPRARRGGVRTRGSHWRRQRALQCIKPL